MKYQRNIPDGPHRLFWAGAVCSITAIIIVMVGAFIVNVAGLDHRLIEELIDYIRVMFWLGLSLAAAAFVWAVGSRRRAN